MDQRAATDQITTAWRIEVHARSADLDARGRDVLADVRRLGFEHVTAVRATRVYNLDGNLDRAAVKHVARTLLCDPVSEISRCMEGVRPLSGEAASIEVFYKPGVMDPAAMSAAEAIRDCLQASNNQRSVPHPSPSTGSGTGVGHPRLTTQHSPLTASSVRTGWRYEIEGISDAEELERIARGVLANDCVEEFSVFVNSAHAEGGESAKLGQSKLLDRRDKPRACRDLQPGGSQSARAQPHTQERGGKPRGSLAPRTVTLRGLDGTGLDRLSRDGHLFLSRAEMEAIRDHFASIGREPTDLELETFAQTWSEHCVHKTLKSAIVYRGEDFGRAGTVEVRFDNLLKDTIARATRELGRDWCLSVFVDNAGIVAFDEDFGVAFKVETHNHPSAIEPYGGAATGLGGCIRDIMGCGLGAKPIASTDVFCVAPPDYPNERLPRGVLHPARTLKGVVAGVRDYGNRMGIPTVNGAVYFDERYLANPLVYCGCVGLIPRDRISKAPRAGDLIVLVGGRTGRDGIHGATFSSAELTDTHADEFSHAVQIGNAIEEKKVLDALLAARDHASGCLFSAVTDCGAGGLSSAVGEMAAELGAVVDLETVPLKYAGLRYDEIWISEAQERMVLAVPPERIGPFLAICRAEGTEATVIGRFTGDGRLTVRYEGVTVGDLDTRFLHEGLPRATREAMWTRRTGFQPVPHCRNGSGTPHPMPMDASEKLLRLLATPNIASKEWIIRQYDHEVQGGSVLKPLVGPGSGPGDAAVLRPRLDGHRGIALGCGLCPHVSDRDPYWMAVLAVDEALRNVICVGADPGRTAILDNFCWGDCGDPESLGGLVRACKGAYDAAVAFGLPFISGKDSLNNFFTQPADEAKRLGLPEKLSIPGTLLISALGIVPDVRRCVSMDPMPGGVLALVAAPADRVGLPAAANCHRRVAEAIRNGEIAAAHDLSDGGLAVAAAEMCIASGLGLTVTLDEAPGHGITDKLFDEYPTAYLVQCKDDALVARLNGIRIGVVAEDQRLIVSSGGARVVDLPVSTLARSWTHAYAFGESMPPRDSSAREVEPCR